MHKTHSNPVVDRDDAPPAPGPSLRGVRFPATRDELIARARANGAEEEVLERLGEIPARRYADMEDLLSEYGVDPVHGREGQGRGWHGSRLRPTSPKG